MIIIRFISFGDKNVQLERACDASDSKVFASVENLLVERDKDGNG